MNLDEFFKNADDIIDKSAQSPLGLIALMMIVFAIIGFLFFKKDSEKIRIGIFIFLFTGITLLVISVQGNNKPIAKTPPVLNSSSWKKPTPKSPDERALYDYLSALKEGKGVEASNLISDYSLDAIKNMSRDDFASKYKLDYEQGKNLISKYNKIASKLILNPDKLVRSTLVISTIDKDGNDISEERSYALYRANDKQWKVNEFGLVDFNFLNNEPIHNSNLGLTVKPYQVERRNDFMLISFEITSDTSKRIFTGKEPGQCEIEDRVYEGEIVKGLYPNTKHIKLSGFHKNLPSKCLLYSITDENNISNPWYPDFNLQYK